ncbi:metal-dependent hydrolase [Natronomonas salina]|uniref:metal-dependent hydrolase n=1 Tax=Natronomonas salina TaxID=1710540 RepID=UPI0015B50C76|nr:metal-dependent hydrolase [Natronomonas salina]QLD88571.1 metal-dependent hydrolase [Natronomonas salina]
MMLPTHALVGLALATPLALYAPEFAPAALLGALVGGILPDLDMYAGHRKTLHFPTGYPVAAVPAALLAVAWPTAATVALALGLLAAAVHCRMDVYGGGLELRPWEGTSDRAVYDHARGEWLPPRRFIAYDGSPGDLALAALVGVPLFVVLDGAFAVVVAVALTVATVYVALRRVLAELAPTVFRRVPEPLSEYVPERYDGS